LWVVNNPPVAALIKEFVSERDAELKTGISTDALERLMFTKVMTSKQFFFRIG
jgi:hypothetical protein